MSYIKEYYTSAEPVEAVRFDAGVKETQTIVRWLNGMGYFTKVNLDSTFPTIIIADGHDLRATVECGQFIVIRRAKIQVMNYGDFVSEYRPALNQTCGRSLSLSDWTDSDLTRLEQLIVDLRRARAYSRGTAM